MFKLQKVFCIVQILLKSNNIPSKIKKKVVICIEKKPKKLCSKCLVQNYKCLLQVLNENNCSIIARAWSNQGCINAKK